jgi:lysophospholipase L1-like esterase
MKKLFLIIFLAFFLVIVILLSLHKAKKPTIQSDYQIKFSSDLLSSNLYPPDNLKVDKVTSESAELTWDFKDMHLIVGEGDFPEYAIHSGYRIYRNGQWYADTLGVNKSFLDTDLYPGKTYTYEISALTFDNKIEGQKSEILEVKTEGNANNIKNILKIDTVLIEGDSVARGQRANPGNGWADQVSSWLIKKGSKKIYNDSKDNTFSADLEKRIGAEIGIAKPDILIIGVGVNDLFAGNGNLARNSLEEYLQNYKGIIASAGQDVTVVIVGITPAKGKSGKVEVWNSALQDLAYNTNSIFIPTDYLSEKNLVDSIHPNQEAHNEIAQRVISVLYNDLK